MRLFGVGVGGEKVGRVEVGEGGGTDGDREGEDRKIKTQILFPLRSLKGQRVSSILYLLNSGYSFA